MAKADLTAQRLRELFHYDPLTGVFTRKITLSGRALAGSIAGYSTPDGYWRICVDYSDFLAHRLAWLYVNGTMPLFQIDHIDGNGKNNAISNLRDVPNAINAQNRRLPIKNTGTGFLGVSVFRKTLFRAQLMLNGKLIYSGIFKTPEEAHAAYLSAKRLHHMGCTI